MNFLLFKKKIIFQFQINEFMSQYLEMVTLLNYIVSPNHKKQHLMMSKLVKSNQEILDKVKKNLSVSLKYQLNYDYRTGKETIALSLSAIN